MKAWKPAKIGLWRKFRIRTARDHLREGVDYRFTPPDCPDGQHDFIDLEGGAKKCRNCRVGMTGSLL